MCNFGPSSLSKYNVHINSDKHKSLECFIQRQIEKEREEFKKKLEANEIAIKQENERKLRLKDLEIKTLREKISCNSISLTSIDKANDMLDINFSANLSSIKNEEISNSFDKTSLEFIQILEKESMIKLTQLNNRSAINKSENDNKVE